MWPFYVLVFVPLTIQIVAIKGIDYKKKNKFAMIFFFLWLMVLIVLRHKTIGNDTINYMNIFDKICYMNFSELYSFSSEIGYVMLNKIVSFFTHNPQIMIAVIGVLTIVLFMPTYLRLLEDTGLTVALFCIMSTFTMFFSGLRQMLAIGIGLIAYHFVRKKNIWLFLLFVLIAFTFHNSAIMLLLMYPIYHTKITKNWLYFVVPAMALIFIFNKQIFSSLTFLMSESTRFVGDIESTGAYTMIILFVLFGVFSYIVPDESKIDDETRGLRNFLLLSIALQMFAPVNFLAMRMNYYYIIFIPLLIPKIIKYQKDEFGNVGFIARNCMVVFFIAYFLYSAHMGVGLNTFPYKFFWENSL